MLAGMSEFDNGADERLGESGEMLTDRWFMVGSDWLDMAVSLTDKG